MKKFLLILVILIVLLGIYSRFINTSGFKVVEETIAIENLPDAFNDFKIVQFSDLLIGSTKTVADLEDIVREINKLNPDIIVFTGDLISKNYNISEDEVNQLKEYLNSLEFILYKYAIIGYNDDANIDLYKEIINDSDFLLLDDASTYIFYGDVKPIKLTGLSDINELNNALTMSDNLETVYNILLTHEPDNITTIADADVDLVIAGHSLLGQIRIPFLGGIIKKDGARTYIDNYYTINNTTMYVSSGLGTDNNINFRLLNKPEISLYRIIKK